jgi:hypothetical protein
VQPSCTARHHGAPPTDQGSDRGRGCGRCDLISDLIGDLWDDVRRSGALCRRGEPCGGVGYAAGAKPAAAVLIEG